jgi:hypothetical protein
MASIANALGTAMDCAEAEGADGGSLKEQA